MVLQFKPRLNKVKTPGGCHRFSEEIYRAVLDKRLKVRCSSITFAMKGKVESSL
ncbi:hypothetical protein [Siminovitchia terrae]|uniref:hypothetical protein n=1 Tax=Siminovitchia terrae TaxID=1914933 RepID=UPI00163C30ED|nr:hypothetical protein [Siminovitchia terrae]